LDQNGKHDAYLYSTDACLAIFAFTITQKTKHGDSAVHPEHQAVSLFHRENPAPEAFYFPEDDSSVKAARNITAGYLLD